MNKNKNVVVCSKCKTPLNFSNKDVIYSIDFKDGKEDNYCYIICPLCREEVKI